MLENEYKNEIDKIKPDGYIKQKVRKNFAGKKKTPIAFKRAYFGTAVAAVLCVAIALSAIGIFKGINPTSPQNKPITLMKTVKSYNGVYSELSKLKPSFLENVATLISSFAGGFKGGYDAAAPEADMDTGAVDSIGNMDGGTTDVGTGSTNTDHSETTTQVEGVAEADIVKTDGNYIYILTNDAAGSVVKVIDARQSEPKQLSDINALDMIAYEMYLSGDRLVLLGGSSKKNETAAVIYDISSPESPQKIENCSQSGGYNTSRLIGNRLYVITDFYVQLEKMQKNNTSSYIPQIEAKNHTGAISADCIYLYNECSSPEYTVVTAFDIKNGKMLSSQSVLGGSYTVYASTENIITTSLSSLDKTQVARFKLEGDNIELVATGELKGSLLNQFSIDEYKGYFRFVLTEQRKVTEFVSTASSNSLVILDGDLKETGKITDLAPNEKVYSVRFMGDIAYFVTFRQVDPLFSADVSDPKNPKIIGALKIPGFSNYLFPYGEGKLLGLGQNADEYTGSAEGMKLSMFDISDPANVTESDKTDVNAYYSDALYNHKAVLCDYEKNIISFSARVVDTLNQQLFVYSYNDGKFTLRLNEEFDTALAIIRPMYIGDTFYIVTEAEIRYFDINTLEKQGSVYLK